MTDAEDLMRAIDCPDVYGHREKITAWFAARMSSSEARLRGAVDDWLVYFDGQASGLSIADEERHLVERLRAELTLDAARSVPDNAALREAGRTLYHADWQTEDEFIEAFLAAAPASPAGLDVERLARAIYYHDPLPSDGPRPVDSLTRAKAIAFAYETPLAPTAVAASPAGLARFHWTAIGMEADPEGEFVEYVALASPEEASPDA